MSGEQKTGDEQEQQQEVVLTPDEEFSKAFDEGESTQTGGDGGGKAGAAGDDAGKGTDTKTDTKGTKTDTGAAGDGKAKGNEGGGDADPGKGGAAQPTDVEKLRSQFQDMEQRMKSWDGRLAASARENATLKQERDDLAKRVVELETQIKKGGDVNVDKELEALKKEYPDFTPKFWGLLQRELDKRTGDFDARVLAEVDKRVKPVESRVSNDEKERHFAAIRKEHADFADVAKSPEFDAWIQAKPAFEQRGIRDALKSGTAIEINELLTSYKTHRDAAAVSTAAAAEEERKKLEEKRKKQEQDAGAVKSRGGDPNPKNAEADKNDFDKAWNEAPET